MSEVWRGRGGKIPFLLRPQLLQIDLLWMSSVHTNYSSLSHSLSSYPYYYYNIDTGGWLRPLCSVKSPARKQRLVRIWTRLTFLQLRKHFPTPIRNKKKTKFGNKVWNLRLTFLCCWMLVSSFQTTASHRGKDKLRCACSPSPSPSPSTWDLKPGLPL